MMKSPWAWTSESDMQIPSHMICSILTCTVYMMQDNVQLLVGMCVLQLLYDCLCVRPPAS